MSVTHPGRPGDEGGVGPPAGPCAGGDRGAASTDWTSIVLMQENHIDSIATFDQRFQGLVPNVVP